MAKEDFQLSSPTTGILANWPRNGFAGMMWGPGKPDNLSSTIFYMIMKCITLS